jgi:hypothetical protein
MYIFQSLALSLYSGRRKRFKFCEALHIKPIHVTETKWLASEISYMLFYANIGKHT